MKVAAILQPTTPIPVGTDQINKLPIMASVLHNPTPITAIHTLPYSIPSLSNPTTTAATYRPGTAPIPYSPMYMGTMQYNLHPHNMYAGSSQFAYNPPSYPLPYMSPQQHLLNQYHALLAAQQSYQSVTPTVIVSPSQTSNNSNETVQQSQDSTNTSMKRKYSETFNALSTDHTAAGTAQTLSSLLAAASMPELSMTPGIHTWPTHSIEVHQTRIHKVPRRRNYELPESQRWYCPYNCGRWYRNTSSISRTNHIKRCTKVPKNIQDAAIAADIKNKQNKKSTHHSSDDDTASK